MDRPVIGTRNGMVSLSVGETRTLLDPLDAIRVALDLYRAGKIGCDAMASINRVYNDLRKKDFP